MSKSAIIILVIILILAATILSFYIYKDDTIGKLDSFAQCLNDKGATFYGAFWCPHCQNQKALFGKSAKYLNYVECSTPDGNSQLLICQEKNISSYPTWVFADTSRESGEVTLKKLSEKTGCALPQ